MIRLLNCNERIKIHEYPQQKSKIAIFVALNRAQQYPPIF